MTEPVKPKPWSEFCGGKWYRWLMLPEWLAEWFLYLLQRFALIKLTIQGVVAASVIIGFIIFIRETELREVEREDRRQDRAVRKAEMMIAIIESNTNTKEGEASEAIPILEGIVAGGIDLSQLPLNGANLYEANLKGAYLKGANLEGANLEGVYLKGANLSYANLEGANLKGVWLGDADLEGTSLGCVEMMSAFEADYDLKREQDLQRSANNKKVLGPHLERENCSFEEAGMSATKSSDEPIAESGTQRQGSETLSA